MNRSKDETEAVGPGMITGTWATVAMGEGPTWQESIIFEEEQVDSDEEEEKCQSSMSTQRKTDHSPSLKKRSHQGWRYVQALFFFFLEKTNK